MGYCYDYRNRLVCDSCGTSGGVRKRTCPYTVLTDSLRSPRQTLRYCSPPAYCGPCYKDRGGLRGVHGDSCAQGAADSQARYDAVEAGLDRGEFYVAAGFGSWADWVPDGKVGVIFRGRSGEVKALVPVSEYESYYKPKLSDYPNAEILPTLVAV